MLWGLAEVAVSPPLWHQGQLRGHPELEEVSRHSVGPQGVDAVLWAMVPVSVSVSVWAETAVLAVAAPSVWAVAVLAVAVAAVWAQSEVAVFAAVVAVIAAEFASFEWASSSPPFSVQSPSY